MCVTSGPLLKSGWVQERLGRCGSVHEQHICNPVSLSDSLDEDARQSGVGLLTRFGSMGWQDELHLGLVEFGAMNMGPGRSWRLEFPLD